MRLIGTVCIALSCLMYGLSYMRSQSRRLTELDSAAFMLGLMRAELSARLTPLPELVSLLKERVRPPSSEFLGKLEDRLWRLGECDFPELWSGCVRESYRELTADELELLERLGGILGRYDIDKQLQELELCRESFDSAAGLARRELPVGRRLHLGLSCGLGALLIIVLL